MDGSNSEVKVTEEMMVAGVEEYSLFDWGDPGEWTVCAVYRAMEKARRLRGGKVRFVGWRQRGLPLFAPALASWMTEHGK